MKYYWKINDVILFPEKYFLKFDGNVGGKKNNNSNYCSMINLLLNQMMEKNEKDFIDDEDMLDYAILPNRDDMKTIGLLNV